MNLWMSIEVSLREIWGHRFRSLLSMLGIVLGVSSLIATFALTEGMARGVKAMMTEIGGLELVSVVNKEISDAMVDFWNLSPGRTLRDAEVIKESVPLISHVSPELAQGVAVSAGGGIQRLRAFGVWPDYQVISNHQIEVGRFITDMDVELANRCVVIGWSIARNLWPGKPTKQALGKRIFLNNIPFTVVGVLKHYETEQEKAAKKRGEKLSTRGRWNPLRAKNQALLLPYTTLFYEFKSGLFPDNTPGNVPIENIRFRIRDLKYFHQAIEGASRALEVTHRGVDDFDFDTREEWFENMESGLRATRTTGITIAGISLLVGAIGITNIMLASITERVREIGVRRAVGARTRDIFVQILIESVLVSLIGGIIGILFSFGLIQVLVWISPDRNTPSIQITALLISVGFALISGLVSGIYPAWKASRLDPIQALRYE